jgi:hypothetical protein
VSWVSRFAEPIVLKDGAKLASLRQAIAHLVKTVPLAERILPAVLTAAELLTAAAEHGGPIEFARIATLQAIPRSRACTCGQTTAYRTLIEPAQWPHPA